MGVPYAVEAWRFASANRIRRSRPCMHPMYHADHANVFSNFAIRLCAHEHW